jgi:hypothetical protein
LELQNNKFSGEIRDRLRSQIMLLQPADFDNLALQIFNYQAQHNPVYKEYLAHLHIKPENITELSKIPFLPIQFFKNHQIRTGQPAEPTLIFQSSGTTGQTASRHAFHILALLPSYLERNNSSLVYMMQHFIAQTDSGLSGFYLNNTDEMLLRLKHLSENPDGRKVLLLGVTFALLDLAESSKDLSFLKNMPDLTVMDTGGMKGRRQELLREEVHDILTKNFFVSQIHSEYGMTELLSQGYSYGSGLFEPGFSMRILLRDVNDPFSISSHHINATKTGGINVIDLANLDSCSFIETQDLGRFGEAPGTFYVMGRFDNSDIRGCNLMVL